MLAVHRGAKYTERVRSTRIARCGLARRFAIAAFLGGTPVLTLGNSRVPPPPGAGNRALRELRHRLAVWGFTAPWDPRSAVSVAANGSRLSAVVTGWLRLDTTSALPSLAYPDTVHVPVGARRFAIVTTYARDRFHTEIIRRLGADRPLRTRVAAAVAEAATAGHYRGLVLDFESLAPADTGALTAVVRSIADAAHRHRIRHVAVAVPPADTLTYGKRHLLGADLLLVMLYDEHWSTGTPGPIASPDWVRQHLATWISNAGTSRLVVALPVYGYLWKRPAPATVLSFADGGRMATDNGATLARDSASATLHFTRTDSAEGWVSDALVLRRLLDTADSAGVRRIALWRLGLEDPAIWTLLPRRR